jgi:hypothetical protein
MEKPAQAGFFSPKRAAEQRKLRNVRMMSHGRNQPGT